MALVDRMDRTTAQGDCPGDRTAGMCGRDGQSAMDMQHDGQNTRLENSAVHLLHRACQCAGDVFHEEVDKEGLTPRQFAVLLTVAKNEGLSQTDLVEKTGIDRSTLADIIRRMLKKGLVQRRRTKEDARAYAVRLTASGWEALDTVRPAASLADERILAALPPGRRADFIELLTMIVRSIGTEDQAPKTNGA